MSHIGHKRKLCIDWGHNADVMAVICVLIGAITLMLWLCIDWGHNADVMAVY